MKTEGNIVIVYGRDYSDSQMWTVQVGEEDAPAPLIWKYGYYLRHTISLALNEYLDYQRGL